MQCTGGLAPALCACLPACLPVSLALPFGWVRGKKIVAYLFEIPIRFPSKNPYLMKAALPFMAALVPCSRHRHWETQFQAKRLGTLEMRELFLTVTAAFHAVVAAAEEEEA